jgi:zinc transport system ATP-binding protein
MPVKPVEVSGLTLRQGGAEVLKDLCFHVAGGDFLALVGPNGSGKTTLLKCLLGLIPASEGEIRLFGETPQTFAEHHRLGYLPQVSGSNYQGFPATVREIVASGRLPLKNFPKRLTGEDWLAVERILSVLDIADLGGRKIDRLSGGQRQRVFLARAMVADAELLFLDEPTSALDPGTRKSFYQLLRRINREQGRSIVMVTHDSGSIGEYATTLLYIDHTQVFFGSFEDFCHSPAMTAYFGSHAQHLMCRQHGGDCR